MVRYISENSNYDLRVNGSFQTQVYFKLSSVDTVAMNDDNYGMNAFVIVLNNRTTIECTRTDRNESVRLITDMFNILIDQLSNLEEK